MNLHNGLEKIDSYFSQRTPDQFHNDLLECGLNDIKSWSETGIELANINESKTYTVKTNQFEFNEEKSYSAYNSEFTEAA